MTTPIPLPPRLRRVLRPLYFRFTFIRQRLWLRRAWQQSRRAETPSFFPALKSYNLSTRSYLRSHPAPGSAREYIAVPDNKYFEPPPPKTPDDNPLAHQVIPTNSPLFVAKLHNPRIYGVAGDVITNDNVLLPDVSFRHVVNLRQERGEHLPLERSTLRPAQPLQGRFALLTARYGGMAAKTISIGSMMSCHALHSSNAPVSLATTSPCS